MCNTYSEAINTTTTFTFDKKSLYEQAPSFRLSVQTFLLPMNSSYDFDKTKIGRRIPVEESTVNNEEGSDFIE
jgi:hypothetical protein